MNILNEIVASKKIEIEKQRALIPVSELVKFPLFNRKCISLVNAIKDGTGIIAEYKRKSPSAGELSTKSIEEVVHAYGILDVSGISVLTDEKYFGGSISDVTKTRVNTNAPILRKEFIIDEYQLFEAKAYGADAVLLIASILDDYHAKYLTSIASSIGLEVLMEFHTKEELSKLNEDVDIVGINNRNLDTLQTNIQTSIELRKYLPYNKVCISESGIKSKEDIHELRTMGYDGFLIGQSILENGALLRDLSNELLVKKD